MLRENNSFTTWLHNKTRTNKVQLFALESSSFKIDIDTNASLMQKYHFWQYLWYHSAPPEVLFAVPYTSSWDMSFTVTRD